MNENTENNDNNDNNDNIDNIQPESRPEPEISDSLETEHHDQVSFDPEHVQDEHMEDDQDSLYLEDDKDSLNLENDRDEQELHHDQEPGQEKKPPSRFARFMRKALIGLVIVALIFLAGFLVDHFFRYAPLSDELDETRVELEQTSEELSDLEDENLRLTRANQAADDEIADLEDELEAATTNLMFYQVLVNANTARLELFLENIEGAEMALVETQDNLEDLLPFIEEVDFELALSLPRRLELIISGLERDPETARVDLELLTKDLLELEPLLVEE